MADKVTVDNFADVLMEEMARYSKACSEEVKDIVKDESKKARKEIKQASPKNTGEYAKKWGRKVVFENSTYVKIVISNKDYRLVHLLEKGHQLRRGGRAIGEVRPIEHVAPVQKKLESEVEKRIKEAL